MKAPPSQVLILTTHDSTVFLGPPSTWGMDELGSFTVLDKWDETSRDRDALQVLHTLKGDDWQVTKLRTYLAGSAVSGHNTYTVRTTRHDTEHVFGTLRAHLRSHRLRAVVIRNHHGQAMSPPARHGAALQAAGVTPLPPLSPGLMAAQGTQKQTFPAGQVGVTRTPANITDWSTMRRLDALLEDSLPLLGKDLQAHLHTLMSEESLIRLTEGLALMAGLQAIPGVGEAADAVFLGIAYWKAGWDGLRAVAVLAGAITKAVRAQHEADIAGAAPEAAQGLSLLGSAFLDATILRMAKRNTSGGGKAANSADAEEEAEAQTVDPNRGQGVGKKDGATQAPTIPGGPVNLDAKPTGIQYDGKVYRLEDPSRVETTFDVHPGNIAANHRYSGPGEGAVYGATSPETALAEVDHYGLADGRVSVSKDVSLQNVLDLTNPSTRQQLNITSDSITSDSYSNTQQIGSFARSNGYDGILAPSARNPTGSNLIIFPSGPR